jgi:rfaE bifunctional protein kinase chain/domain
MLKKLNIFQIITNKENKMTDFLPLIDKIKPKNILIIGDYMIDHYIFCKATNLCQEAPVATNKVQSEDYRLGGAGNVAKIMYDLGCNVYCAGVVGYNDDTIEKLLNSIKANISVVIISHERSTTIKNRIISNNHYITRFDKEETKLIDTSIQDVIVEGIEKYIHKIDAVIISDYGKGVIAPELMQKIKQLKREYNFKIFVDPKPENINLYSGVDLLKPNEYEYDVICKQKRFVNLNVMLNTMNIDKIVVTESSKGMRFIEKTKIGINGGTISCQERKKVDITGAGDLVIAYLTLCLLNDIDLRDSCEIANYTAGMSIEKMGAVSITLDELRKDLMEGMNGKNV